MVSVLGFLRTTYVLRLCFDTPNYRTGRATKYFQREPEEGEQGVEDNGVKLVLHRKLHLPGVPTVCNFRYTYITTTPKAERM